MKGFDYLADFCKVLLVDDEILLRNGLKHLLNWEKEGFKVIGEASTGLEALKIIEKEKPHIIISDIVMPSMDGVSLCQKINEKYPEIQIIILSSYSDFKYVKETFKYGVKDYILKPSLSEDSLLSLLKKLALNIPGFKLSPSNGIKTLDNALNNYFYGKTSQDDKQILNDFFTHDSFTISCSKTTTNSLFTLEAIQKYLKNHDVSFNVQAFCPSSNLICIIANYNSNINIEIEFKNLINNICNDNSNLFFVISNPFYEIEKCPKVYEKEIKTYLNYKFYFPNLSCILYKNIKITTDIFNLKKYSEYLYCLDIDNSMKYLSSYIKNLKATFFLDSLDVKSLCNNAIYTTISILDTMNYDVSKLKYTKTDYFSLIDNTTCIDEVINVINSFCLEIQSIQSIQEEPRFHFIDKILDYIENNYNEQLSLKMLAEKFHFNYYYLSSYFSTHNDEGFSEYLNKIRIQKSIELLENHDISISEISYMVGYSDNSYFCKVFKKFTGYTPSRYKKMYIEGR